MKFMFQVILKLTFLASLMPYLLSEKIYNKYHVRINPQVVDTLYYSGKEVGLVDRKLLKEASGLAASREYDNMLYTHNDSGGEPVVYKLDSVGRVKGEINLEGTRNRDWEDIAVGPDASGDKSYVFVGEIGDNDGKYPSISLLRFEEPVEDSTSISVKPHKTKLTYPDGPRDAETLMVDPWNGDVYIVSKRDSSNVLYRAPADKLDDEEVELEPLQKLPITMSVGGDISPDGKEIIIKNYWVIYHWTRKEGESIAEALSRSPMQLPYVPEPQGEALTFSKNGSSFFSLSEERFRIKPVLYQYYQK
ncbi:hypothetical protein DN752_08365 [Echinicola strongylocentroti]|uniref:PE-PGRS family protein n=1 Tax=Echinicola strongylocentroti TaxID=1795355 RepID=A0A2Z4II83_9BACT|nr:hypothetical protein [Echinicola strongylocentroti]AWW30133.1 hypothetical protein DN752_08365 [Echinicola strongylocentroti]